MTADVTTLTAPAIQPTNREGVYRAQSDSGSGSYLCSPAGAGFCECPAGARGRACKHVERARSFVADSLRAQAKARGIVVLRGASDVEMTGSEPGDLYGPAEHCGLDECDCEDYGN